MAGIQGMDSRLLDGKPVGPDFQKESQPFRTIQVYQKVNKENGFFIIKLCLNCVATFYWWNLWTLTPEMMLKV